MTLLASFGTIPEEVNHPWAKLAVCPISKYTTFHTALIDQRECKHKNIPGPHRTLSRSRLKWLKVKVCFSCHVNYFECSDEVSTFKRLVKKSKEDYIHAFCNLFQGHRVPVKDSQVCHIQISYHYVIYITSVLISVYSLLLLCVFFSFQ